MDLARPAGQGLHGRGPARRLQPAGTELAPAGVCAGKLRAAAYEPFIQTIRAALRHAAGLRIDHVMGLFRLYWIPEGCSPAQGAYVRYPADDLLGIVALESRRAGALVVGEDLGTVEPGVRAAAGRGQHPLRPPALVRAGQPADYPSLAMAVATTHDLPTLAGLWTGADLAAQQAAGPPADEECRICGGIYRRLLGLPADAPVERVIEATYRLLGRGPVGDPAGLAGGRPGGRRAAQHAGHDDQWPNWRLALPGGLEALEAAELPCRIAKFLNRPVAAADHVPLREGDVS